MHSRTASKLMTSSQRRSYISISICDYERRASRVSHLVHASRWAVENAIRTTFNTDSQRASHSPCHCQSNGHLTSHPRSTVIDNSLFRNTTTLNLLSVMDTMNRISLARTERPSVCA